MPCFLYDRVKHFDLRDFSMSHLFLRFVRPPKSGSGGSFFMNPGTGPKP